MFYSLQKQRKHSEERSFGRFKMSLKCDRMFTLVSSKCNPVDLWTKYLDTLENQFDWLIKQAYFDIKSRRQNMSKQGDIRKF